MGERQFTHQLGSLADINTKNPAVIETFKQTYGDWIEKAGIDAIRIDTVRYVEPEFFTQFMSDENGIAARAKATGRDDFLVFGEVLDYSQPFENSGEKALAEYLSTPDREILPAVISFPLKQEIKSVFGQGKPTAQIAYRLEQHMEIFPNPYVTPTLVDNHDVARFLASGSEDGFKQAFALIFTIPGIPTIYQGSAQGFTETRQAMFAGGYLSDQDHFNTETELYKFIASLAALRTSEITLRRGSFEVLASNPYEAGLVAYRRKYDADVLDVIFNTSDQPILVDNLTLPDLKDGPLDLVYALNFEGSPKVRDGQLTAILPPRAFFVSRGSTSTERSDNRPDNLSQTEITTRFPEGTVLTSDFELMGNVSRGERDLLIVKNGSLEGATRVTSNANGNWSYSYPVENLGEESFYLVAYDPETDAVSERLNINTNVTEPTISITVPDPRDDDVGPEGRYIDMKQANAIGQKDILKARVAAGGDVLEIEFSMAEVTSEWLPPNQFDNVSFSIFFDLPDQVGVQPLPQLNSNMPDGLDWDIGHVAFGWGNTMFSAEGANDNRAGIRYSSAPSISVNEETRFIKFTYDGSDFGVSDWEGTNIYVTTWDIAGEGAYVRLAPEPADWTFGGGEEGDPRILDDLIISLGDAK